VHNKEFLLISIKNIITNIQDLMKKSTREEIDKYATEKMTDEQQHYVPIVYLKWFSKEWFVIVYDLQNKNFLWEWKPIPPKTICKEWDFYVAMTKNRQYSYAIEKILFSDFLEWNIWSVIWKLKRQEKLDEFEHNVLTSFIAFQFLRTEKQKLQYEERSKLMHKYFIEEIMWLSWNGDYDVFAKNIEKYQKATWKKLWDIKKLFNIAKDYELEAILPKEDYIKYMLKTGTEITQYLLNCKITIHHTKKNNRLITNDNPFYIIPPKWRKYELWDKINWIWLLLPNDARKIIHLSETIAVECFPHDFIPWWEIIHRFLNQKSTKIFNAYLVKNAKRFIIWSSEENIQDTIKNIDFKEIEKIKEIPIVKFFEDEKIIWTFWIYPL